jgi:di/tricarboxylate transporter
MAVSAFVNNTPVVVVFLPILVSIAKRNDLTLSKLLIPLSFASILGGTSTLIGTSTNLVTSTAGVHAGLPPIRMFEMTPVGLLLCAVGLVYVLVFAPGLLPRRVTVTGALPDSLGRRHFLTEAFVPEGSALVGHTAAEAMAHLRARGKVVDVVRDGVVQAGLAREIVLQAGDRLRIEVDADTVTALKHRRSLKLDFGGDRDLAIGSAAEAHLVECVVSPHSAYAGRSIAETDLRQRGGLVVLALHRRGVNLRERLTEIALQTGDVLLIEATDEMLRTLAASGDLLVLAGAQRLPRRRKRWIAVLLIVAVVSLAAWQIVPITVGAIAASLAAVALGCIDTDEAYRAIDWPTLFLIAGTLAMGAALERTHTAEFAAQVLVRHLESAGPTVALSVIVLAASLLTNFLSNNAVAALLVPIALQLASALHVAGRPFLMAVAFGASACFATPIGYQTNTLVFTAGGYRFSDFVRIGLPLNIVYWLVASWLVPVFWPL